MSLDPLKSPSRPQEKAYLFLIRPSNYDDAGYVVRYLRGILPSNTLGCLLTLTQQALLDGRLGTMNLQIRLIDEMVMRIPLKKMARLRQKGYKVIACLVGVQSNQFPRAADLAKEFRRHQLAVLIGGFHVSGILASGLPIPGDIQELMDAGVTIVKGEVEQTWASLLEDALEGRLQPLYDFLGSRPDLTHAPIPRIPKEHLRYFVSTNFGAVDCGRGCPYQCTFCCVIAVQGRKMRYRSPEDIAAGMRENYRRNGTSFYFLTDDNFSRNQHWKEILEAMTRLREREQIPLRFMMQVDVQSYRIPGFVEKARKAGCTQAFIGLESVNIDNLKAVGKHHNSLEDYHQLIQTYRQAEIAVHAGYILGLPYDTPESLRRDVRFLMDEIQVDHVSFFILTPLPGSRDHEELRRQPSFIETDYNQYEYFHETMTYPGFPEKGSLVTACLEAWQAFYEFSHLQRILERTPARLYWDALRNFIWYKNAVEIDRRHPMMSGYFRLRNRLDIRPGQLPISRWVFYCRRINEVRQVLLGYLGLILEMQLLWLTTRHRLSSSSEKGCNINAPGTPVSFLRKLWNPFALSTQNYPPEKILKFWSGVRSGIRQGEWQTIPWIRIVGRLLLDARLTLRFSLACMRQMKGFFRTFFPDRLL